MRSRPTLGVQNPPELRRVRGALASRCFGADRVRAFPGLHDFAGLRQLLLILLLADEVADSGRDLTDAVADRQIERVDLEDNFLEVSQSICHSIKMIPAP